MNLGQTVRRLGLTLSVTLAAGCASTPPPDGDLISGRLALQVAGQPDKSLSGGFELSGSPRAGQLLLSGPFGTTALRARWAPGEAVLSSAQGESRHADLDALAAVALGEAIPMAALFDWLRGRPWPGAAATPRDDGQAGFAQLGWQVDLSRWSAGAIEVQRAAPPVITVRARLQQAP